MCWLYLPLLCISQEVKTGFITPDELLITDHRKWFEENYIRYNPEMSVIQSFPPIEEKMKIIIVMGVWCSDSRELVPAFLKVMDMWHFNHQHIEMILVDHNKNAPVRGFKKLHINYIPTIIFFNQKGREIGRIVETVSHTIEAEIKAILSRHYQAVQMEP